MASLNSVLKALFGSKADKDRKQLQPIVAQVNALWPELKALSNDALRARAQALRAKVKGTIATDQEAVAALKQRLDLEALSMDEREGLFQQIDEHQEAINTNVEAALNEALPEAFAIIRETARRFKEQPELEVTPTDFDRLLAGQGRDFLEIRGDKAVYFNHWMAGGAPITWDMVHYDVQIMGGAVLHQGKIAEMATGEGKTLVATLPVFLNALPGLGVHIVTVNDYLSKRDSEWMGPIYMFHGLSVDCIDRYEPNSPERRKAYQADITFGTNNEFGFDYLRDNMAFSMDGLVQREHNYAIVDEVDSVLIDDARTPLIISGPTASQDDQKMFQDFLPNVRTLVDAQQKLVTGFLTEAKKLLASDDAKEKEKGGIQLLRVFKGLPKYKPLIKFESEPGIKNVRLKTENFYMQNNSKDMHIVTDELYFVIDEKRNSVELTDKGIDLISQQVNDKDFFILPNVAERMADIEQADAPHDTKDRQKEELLRQYSDKAERLHTVQQLLRAFTMFERDVEYVVSDNAVKIVDEQTGRVLEGRRYSEGLHQAIEAKEGVKVEAATQTYATVTLQNYFRMYHKLAGMTGTAETEAGEFWSIYKLDVVVIPTNRPIARVDHEDKVYKTVREKYNAVIQEIEALVAAGRPVLVGTTSVEISEQLSRMLRMRKIPHNVLNAKQFQREALVVAEAGRKGQVTIATNMAGRGTDIKLTEEVRQAGGLAIVGTERHESRRVDRQLRGRAGRQGDPGSSQFFVSLEDNLMRLFGSERMVHIMDRLGLKEGEVIQHPWISKSIERAQRKVEQNNFGIRKRLLEYDDVMNLQRERIYTRRRHALSGERLDEDIRDLLEGVCYELANEFEHLDDFQAFRERILSEFAMEPTIAEQDYLKADGNGRYDLLEQMVWARYQLRMNTIAERAMPIFRRILDEHGAQIKNVLVPISDGKRTLNIPINLQKAVETDGRELAKGIARSVVLLAIDDYWQQHLLAMDELKQSVQNASYEQKDPLLIYKFEGYELFEKMISELNRNILQVLLKAHLPLDDQRSEVKENASNDMAVARKRRSYKTGRGEAQAAQAPQYSTNQTEEGSTQPVKREGAKIGRNDPCPCGSGKKYKNCHGAHLPA